MLESDFCNYWLLLSRMIAALKVTGNQSRNPSTRYPLKTLLFIKGRAHTSRKSKAIRPHNEPHRIVSAIVVVSLVYWCCVQ